MVGKGKRPHDASAALKRCFRAEMRRDILVRQPRELTVTWAQRVVDQRGAGVRVSRVDLLSTDIGTTTRVRLAVEHDGPESLARRWFVKLPSGSLRARWITALPRL